MKELKKDIEQLEEVARQLEKGTSTGARIALLLLDNSVELLMYKKIRLEFAYDSLYKLRIPPKYSIKKRKDINDNFNKKVNFLITEKKIINEDEGDVIKKGHLFRNEAYHVGVLREAIIKQIAMVYFEIACKLFPRLWVKAYSSFSDADVELFLRSYGIQEAMITTENLSKICNHISTGAMCPIEELCRVLSGHLVERIDEMKGQLDELALSSREETADDILKRIQFAQKLEELDFPETEEGFQMFIKKRNELWPTYKPPITLERIERWKERAFFLQKEKMPGSALKKFLNLDSELLPIEKKIEDTIIAYEEMIDAMIHDR